MITFESLLVKSNIKNRMTKEQIVFLIQLFTHYEWAMLHESPLAHPLSCRVYMTPSICIPYDDMRWRGWLPDVAEQDEYMIPRESSDIFSLSCFPVVVSISRIVLAYIFPGEREWYPYEWLISREYPILSLWCRTPIPPEYHMFPCIERLKQVSEMCRICILDRSSEFVPWLGRETRLLGIEFLMEVYCYSISVYPVSCLLALTSLIESYEFLIRISPYTSYEIHREVVMWESCDDIVLTARISECRKYSFHRCDLTRELILLDAECIVETLVSRRDSVPCAPYIPDTYRCLPEESWSDFLILEQFSTTGTDCLIETEHFRECCSIFLECRRWYNRGRHKKKSSNQENNTKKHREIIKKLKAKTHSATQASYCRSLTSRRVQYVFLSRPPVLTRVRGYHLPCVRSGAYEPLW